MNKKKLMDPKRINSFYTNKGNPLKEQFHGKITESGTIELVSDGFINTDEIIASYAPETDLENIITRIMAGEIDLLNQRKGAYIDTIGMPKTYAEVLQAVIDGQNMFEQLPADIRERFGNDFNQWFAQMDDDDFMLKSGFIKEVEQKVEVNADES